MHTYFKRGNFDVRLIVFQWKQHLCLLFGHQVLSHVGRRALWQIMQIRFCRQFHMTDRSPNWQLAGVGSMLAGCVWLGWRQVKWRHPLGSKITSADSVFPVSLVLSTFRIPEFLWWWYADDVCPSKVSDYLLEITEPFEMFPRENLKAFPSLHFTCSHTAQHICRGRKLL